MKSAYKQYMDRQTVSADLHSRLLALEDSAPAQASFPVRPLAANRHWRVPATLAASLVLVAGLGWFSMRLGIFGGGKDLSGFTAADTSAPAEDLWDDYDADAPEAAAPPVMFDAPAANMDAEAVSGADSEYDRVEASESDGLNVVSEEPAEPADDGTVSVGDAPSVVAIVSAQSYPDGYVYDHIQIHSDAEPYGLDVYLTGGSGTTAEALEDNSADTFRPIGNLGVLTYYDSESGELLAQFRR